MKAATASAALAALICAALLALPACGGGPGGGALWRGGDAGGQGAGAWPCCRLSASATFSAASLTSRPEKCT